jgi:hypothetical protein
VTFNTPSFVDGLFAETHNLGLSLNTGISQFSGLKLVNEAYAQLDTKKGLLRTLVSNKAYVGVFDGLVEFEGMQCSGQSKSYAVKEGDLIVMVASWNNVCEIQSNSLLIAIQTFTSAADIGEKYLNSLENPDSLSFIIARVVRYPNVKPTFIRLRREVRKSSSDSFDGPMPLKPIGSGTIRLPSLTLGWSSGEDFGQAFVPEETDTDLEEDIVQQDESGNVFESDRQRRRRRGRENCSVQK